MFLLGERKGEGAPFQARKLLRDPLVLLAVPAWALRAWTAAGILTERSRKKCKVSAKYVQSRKLLQVAALRRSIQDSDAQRELLRGLAE